MNWEEVDKASLPREAASIAMELRTAGELTGGEARGPSPIRGARVGFLLEHGPEVLNG